MSEPNKTDKQGFVLFTTSGENLAIPLSSVHEIVAYCTLDDVPGMPKCLWGFLNLEGVLVPVLRLDFLLRLTEQKITLYSHIVIIKANNSRFLALVADRVHTTFIATPRNIHAIDETRVFNQMMTQCISYEEKTYNCLNIDHLLLSEENARIDEFRAIGEERLRHAG